ncbi:MAG: hypothetical protein AAF750_05990 [Planctomycetota bacterium]
MQLRSPYYWMHTVKSPMYVLEGEFGNWQGAVEVMARQNSNPNVSFIKVPNHDHFTVIAPLVELLAAQIVESKIRITEKALKALR